ncbi:MAG: hypothetical protein ACK56W_13355, partial [Pirellula sp.]
ASREMSADGEVSEAHDLSVDHDLMVDLDLRVDHDLMVDRDLRVDRDPIEGHELRVDYALKVDRDLRKARNDRKEGGHDQNPPRGNQQDLATLGVEATNCSKAACRMNQTVRLSVRFHAANC